MMLAGVIFLAFFLGVACLWNDTELSNPGQIAASTLAFGTASLLFVSLVMNQWLWLNTGFCSACGAQVATRRLSWTPSWDIDVWCSDCGQLMHKDAILVGTPELIDVEACAELPTPCARLVGALLWLALQRQADAMVFVVEDDIFQSRIIHGGETVQCDYLPSGLRACVSKVIQTMGGLEGESGTSLAMEVGMQVRGAVFRARIVVERFLTPGEKITIERIS